MSSFIPPSETIEIRNDGLLNDLLEVDELIAVPRRIASRLEKHAPRTVAEDATLQLSVEGTD